MSSKLVFSAPYRLEPDGRWLWVLIGFWISIAIHVQVLLLIAFFGAPKDADSFELKNSVPIELVQMPSQEVVKTLQETATEKPKDAKFISDRDLSTDDESSPEVASLDMASLGKRGGASKEAPKPERRRESFSLSSLDREALNDPLQGGRASESMRFSPGFMKKLKRGDELKANALGLDYGQYYLRMKEKLAQRWSPQRSVSPAMYQYNEITVLLAVVLNSEGELVDLQILRPSSFPAYDQTTIEAMRQAAPFPNPPKSIIQDDGRVYVTWGFSLYMRGVGFAGGAID